MTVGATPPNLSVGSECDLVGCEGTVSGGVPIFGKFRIDVRQGTVTAESPSSHASNVTTTTDNERLKEYDSRPLSTQIDD